MITKANATMRVHDPMPVILGTDAAADGSLLRRCPGQLLRPIRPRR